VVFFSTKSRKLSKSVIKESVTGKVSFAEENFAGGAFLLLYCSYIYRIFDFTEKQFVLARDMIVSSDFQTVVVGFLCECNDAKTYKDNEWVELEGEIVKGDYHGDMPIIKVTYINRIDIPNEEIVYPPDSSFVQTSTVL